MTTPAERPSPEIKELVEAFSNAVFAEGTHYGRDSSKDIQNAASERVAETMFALFAALSALEEDKKHLQQQVDRLRAAGFWLSNAAFNLSQPDVPLTPQSRQSLKRAQEYWDTALRAGGKA